MMLELFERAAAPFEQCCLPEQNADAVMPTVWAIRIAAGKGDIATRWSKEVMCRYLELERLRVL